MREPNTLVKAHCQGLGDGKREKFVLFIPDTEAIFLRFSLAFLQAICAMASFYYDQNPFRLNFVIPARFE